MGEKVKKPRWKKKYEEWKANDRDAYVKELEDKISKKAANKDEFKEYKEISKISENIPKVENIMELRDHIYEKLVLAKKELNERGQLGEDSVKNFSDLVNLELKLENLLRKQQVIDSKIKNAKTPEEKEKLKIEKQGIIEEINQNGEEYSEKAMLKQKIQQMKNAKVVNSQKTDFKTMSEKELNEVITDLSTKVSKCDLAASNLMKGKDISEMSLDVSNKQYTSGTNNKSNNQLKNMNKPETDVNIFSSSKKEEEYNNNVAKNNQLAQKKEELIKKIEEKKDNSKLPTKNKGMFAKIKNLFNSLKDKVTTKLTEKKLGKIEEEMKELGIDKDNGTKSTKEDKFDEYLKAVAEDGVAEVGEEGSKINKLYNIKKRHGNDFLEALRKAKGENPNMTAKEFFENSNEKEEAGDERV